MNKMYHTSAVMPVFITWQKQQACSQAQTMNETNHNDIQLRSGLKKMIDCWDDQQPTGSPGYRFTLKVEDLMLLCDEESPNGGGMDVSAALLPRIIAACALAEKTDMRIQSSCTPPFRYQDCHLIWAAHQERTAQVHLATTLTWDSGFLSNKMDQGFKNSESNRFHHQRKANRVL